ncbi:MAG: hypothetical protein WDA20_09545 [Desulfuromonadales bacterium]
MNKKRLLIILVGILTLSLLYAHWGAPRQERIADPARRPATGKNTVASAQGGGASSMAGGDDLRVRLELLQREEGRPSKPRRDLFAPLYKNKPQAAPAPPLPPPVAVAVPVPLPSVASPLVRQPPPAQFAFLGFLQKEVEKTVFVSTGDEIFVVKNGDRFGRERQFAIAELTAERLVIRQDDRPQPITISLRDGGPAAAPERRAGQPYDLSRARPRPMETPMEESAEAMEVPENDESQSMPEAQAPRQPGLLQPVPRSDFNAIFSEAAVRMPDPRDSAIHEPLILPEEVPR